MTAREVKGVLIPDAETRKALRRKKRLRQLPPPACPKCRADLRDKNVPDRYREYAEMFGHAREVTLPLQMAIWECPRCLHRFDKHPLPA